MTGNEPAELYIHSRPLGKPQVYLHPDGYIALTWYGENYRSTHSIHVHEASEARANAQAWFQAWRLLNPDGPLDTLIAELLDEPHLAAILARAREEEARGSDVQPDPYIDAMAAEHVREYEPGTAQPEDIPVLLDRATGCPECGAVGLPRREDGTCWNAAGCHERQAAKAGAR